MGMWTTMTSGSSLMLSDKNPGSEFKDISNGWTDSFGKAKSLMPNNGGGFWPGELEQLENLVKIARRKKDAELEDTQVRRGLGTDVEVLPLTMVNLIQRSDPEDNVCNKGTAGKSVPANLEADDELLSWCAPALSPPMTTQESESEIDSNEESDEGSQQGSSVEVESEFRDTGLEILVSSEGPRQILQITLQNQANEVMKEELSDADDYADWIRWATDGEHCKQNPSEAANITGKSVLLQEGYMAEEVDPQESKRIRKRAKQYCWRDNKLYFKGLYIPRPKERLKLVTQMHEDLGHFGE
ncbi:unnamed protein product [Sphagnum troendelagicum]|uniref:Integrase zinc-binding domain-containing protein n=1 Tax=Sphagnum troendelagicum TaxID=128251 RepID=A0ABP0TR78_9BRYO